MKRQGSVGATKKHDYSIWRPVPVITTLMSDVQYVCIINCAPKLARKYEIEHWSRSSKTCSWSADSFQINHFTSMSWHMSPRYGHVILISGYPVLTAVNWPYCEKWMSNIKDVRLPRHAWDTPSFHLIVSPTPPVQSVDVYARSITWQPNEKQLTIFHESRAWEPR